MQVKFFTALCTVHLYILGGAVEPAPLGLPRVNVNIDSAAFDWESFVDYGAGEPEPNECESMLVLPITSAFVLISFTLISFFTFLITTALEMVMVPFPEIIHSIMHMNSRYSIFNAAGHWIDLTDIATQEESKYLPKGTCQIIYSQVFEGVRARRISFHAAFKDIEAAIGTNMAVIIFEEAVRFGKEGKEFSRDLSVFISENIGRAIHNAGHSIQGE